jgi:hypothetical protein
MSRFFNFKRAHDEWARPQFDKLSQQIKRLFEKVVECSEFLGQGKDLSVQFKSLVEDDGHAAVADLKKSFEACDPQELADAAEVIYACGHWHYDRERPFGKNGAYWKFQALVKTHLIKLWGHSYSEDTVKERLGRTTDDFMDHEPGTSYSLDEMPELFQPHLEGVFRVLDAQTVNHDPHPFVIGAKHLTGKSIYLDPDAAPCAAPGCNLSYKQHTYDKVLFLQAARDLENKEAAEALDSVKGLMEEHKLDGFVFVESEFDIAPPPEGSGREADDEDSENGEEEGGQGDQAYEGVP